MKTSVHTHILFIQRVPNLTAQLQSMVVLERERASKFKWRAACDRRLASRLARNLEATASSRGDCRPPKGDHADLSFVAVASEIIHNQHEMRESERARMQNAQWALYSALWHSQRRIATDQIVYDCLHSGNE